MTDDVPTDNGVDDMPLSPSLLADCDPLQWFFDLPPPTTECIDIEADDENEEEESINDYFWY
jgi:hypothetical protein